MTRARKFILISTALLATAAFAARPVRAQQYGPPPAQSQPALARSGFIGPPRVANSNNLPARGQQTPLPWDDHAGKDHAADGYGPRPLPVRRPSPRVVSVPPQAPESRRPPGTPAAAASHGPDGTWREEGQFVIINLNGQEYRLVKSGDGGTQRRPTQTGGSVLGRLSNRGRPLAGCEVVLVPLQETWTGYRIASSDASELPRSVTDASGVYRFANIPAGLYKLKWRAAGEASWIRRAEIRPDVRVRPNEATQVKEIRTALRTIN